MKRRTFISTTGKIGLAGSVLSAPVASAAFTSLSIGVSLEEFSPVTKTTLDNFISELSLNIQELGLKKDLAASIAMPIRIIKKSFKNNNHRIIYKNKSGQYISLKVQNGVETIHISNTM